MDGQEEDGFAGRCDSGTRRWSCEAALEDSAGGENGGVHNGHSNEVDLGLQLGRADAGVPGVLTDSMGWANAQVTARWPSEERSMSDLLLPMNLG